MRYVVRAVAWRPERLANVEKMRDQIPHLEVVTDHVGDGYATLFETCRLINDTGAVMLEDDAILCRDFCRRAEQVIADHGAGVEVVNFFEKPKVNVPKAFLGGSNFISTVCTYLPPGLPLKIVENHDEFKAARYQEWTGMAYDNLIKYTLVKERRKYWRIRPALVQHHNFKSTIGHRALDRQTHFFIDDLESHTHDLRLPE